MSELPRRALLDPALAMAPGLFRSLSRGAREVPLQVRYGHGDEVHLFRSPVRLGCDDLRILQGVAALATRSRKSIGAGSPSPKNAALRAGLSLVGAAAGDPVLLVETNFAELAKVAGYGDARGGAMSQLLRGGLDRLAGCRARVVGRSCRRGWRLLAWDCAGTGKDRLRIVLNPRLGACALGEARFTMIDLEEACRLNDVGRLLHQRLCGWIDPPRRRDDDLGDGRRVRLATLIDYAYPPGSNDEPQPSADAVRQRRATARKALVALASSGWAAFATDRECDVYQIVRPASVGSRPVRAVLSGRDEARAAAK